MISSEHTHRILQKDGMLVYVQPSGETFSLSKLAMQCKFRIDQLCAEMEISPRHLRRLFDQSLGVSPKQWLKLERMVFARKILRDQRPIKDISDELGFTSQKQFLREFQEYYQLAPTAYRQHHGNLVMNQLGWVN